MRSRRDRVDKLYRPGELAELLHVAPPTLRKLSDKFEDFLGDRAARRWADASSRSQRRYTEADRRALERILRLVQEEGFTYDEVLARLTQQAGEQSEQSASGTLDLDELDLDNAWLKEQLRLQDETIAALKEANQVLRRENYDLIRTHQALWGELWDAREKLKKMQAQRDHAIWNAKAYRRDAEARWPIVVWRLICGRD